MPSTIGTALTVTVFGQSHSPAIGCVIEGLPAGFPIDMERLQAFMKRRAPGNASWSTPRKETDEVQILSGLNERGRTCGAPLAALVRNTNTRSSDYDELRQMPRPGHADFAAQAKWQGEQDVRGGGHFSGRLTAPLCIAGGIALQLLETRGVRIGAHLLEVGGITDDSFDAQSLTETSRNVLNDQLDRLADRRDFPVINVSASERMRKSIASARANQDSVGGIIECACTGLPAGVGSPMFDGIENVLARALFGIPAVKGLEFGDGFSAARSRGSENNDPYRIVDGQPRPATNHAGGILGGITTGAPLVFRLAVKPTPSIAQEQESINFFTRTNAVLSVRGRHDPCIAPRAVPVAEAVCAIAVLDAWLAWPPQQRPFETSITPES